MWIFAFLMGINFQLLLYYVFNLSKIVINCDKDIEDEVSMFILKM